jgi:hypothetical protein
MVRSPFLSHAEEWSNQGQTPIVQTHSAASFVSPNLLPPRNCISEYNTRYCGVIAILQQSQMPSIATSKDFDKQQTACRLTFLSCRVIEQSDTPSPKVLADRYFILSQGALKSPSGINETIEAVFPINCQSVLTAHKHDWKNSE